MNSRFSLFAAAVMLSLSACGSKPTTPQAPVQITGREWILVQISDRVSPLGAGQKPASLRFEQTDQRLSGFSGCNGFTGTYTLDGKQLRFGTLIRTKKYCAQGMDLEDLFIATLPGIIAHEITPTHLILSDESGPIMKFQGAPG